MNNGTFGLPESGLPLCYVKRTNTQAVSAGVTTAFSWETFDINRYEMWRFPQPTRIYLPFRGYLVARTNIQYSANSSYTLEIRKNNDATNWFAKVNRNNVTGKQWQELSAEGVVNAGEYLEVYGNFGSAGNIETPTYFAIHYLERFF
jgi:hypothetical protein